MKFWLQADPHQLQLAVNPPPKPATFALKASLEVKFPPDSTEFSNAIIVPPGLVAGEFPFAVPMADTLELIETAGFVMKLL